MMIERPRRLRANPILREMAAETRLHKDMFIYPYFVVPGNGVVEPIEAMPGINHYSIDELLKDVEGGLELGINKILLFWSRGEKNRRWQLLLSGRFSGVYRRKSTKSQVRG